MTSRHWSSSTGWICRARPERWSLTLLPSDARIAAIVQRIRISGTRDELREIEMLQADGDRSVMQIRRDAPP